MASKIKVMIFFKLRSAVFFSVLSITSFMKEIAAYVANL